MGCKLLAWPSFPIYSTNVKGTRDLFKPRHKKRHKKEKEGEQQQQQQQQQNQGHIFNLTNFTMKSSKHLRVIA